MFERLKGVIMRSVQIRISGSQLHLENPASRLFTEEILNCVLSYYEANICGIVWNNLKALAYVNKQFTTNQASLHLYHRLHHQHVWHFLFCV